jgi:hypothetical protein
MMTIFFISRLEIGSDSKNYRRIINSSIYSRASNIFFVDANSRSEERKHTWRMCFRRRWRFGATQGIG